MFTDGVVDRFTAELDSLSNKKIFISCDWSDSEVRKAGIDLEITFEECFLQSDGQNIKISGNQEKNYSIKDLDTNVSYYLRGEEFQRQLDSFTFEVQNKVYNYKNAEEAAQSDKIILGFHEENV